MKTLRERIAGALHVLRHGAAPHPQPGGAAAPARRDELGEVLSVFESDTAAVFERTAPARENAVMMMLVAMLVITVGFAAVVKLDRVVVGTGKIATIGGELYVTPLDRAIIREVRVREGDMVKKGQVLATLDPTFAGADLASLQQRMASAEAEVARRRAEVDGKPYIPAKGSAYAESQRGIWLQRQAEYQSSLADFEARLRAAREQRAQYEHDVREYQKRLDLATKNEEMNANLRKQGYVTKAAMMAATDARVEMGRQLATSQSALKSTEFTEQSVKAQRETYIQKWHSDSAAAMVAAQNDIDHTREELRKADMLNQLVTLEAPEDAVVLKIGKVSQGSVTSSGDPSADPLFTLVPLSAQLEAEIRINADDIGFIRTGDPVQIKLDAYAFIRHGTATGTIKTISEGSFTTDDVTRAATAPYFKARVEIKEVKLRDVPESFRLIPGMTLQADVIVGRRTILSYFLEGALRTGSEAMREAN